MAKFAPAAHHDDSTEIKRHLQHLSEHCADGDDSPPVHFPSARDERPEGEAAKRVGEDVAKGDARKQHCEEYRGVLLMYKSYSAARREGRAALLTMLPHGKPSEHESLSAP